MKFKILISSLLLIKENPRESANGKAVSVIRVPMRLTDIFGLAQKVSAEEQQKITLSYEKLVKTY